MSKPLLKRIAEGVVLSGATIVSFFVLHDAPGDPAAMTPSDLAAPAKIGRVRKAPGASPSIRAQAGNSLKQAATSEIGAPDRLLPWTPRSPTRAAPELTT